MPVSLESKGQAMKVFDDRASMEAPGGQAWDHPPVHPTIQKSCGLIANNCGANQSVIARTDAFLE